MELIKTLSFFVLTILLMAFFAGMEMAFYSANRFGIELKKKQGIASARVLDNFLDNPVYFLGTTLVGFNIFLVFFSLEISNVLSPIWQYGKPGSYTLRILIEILISTVVIIFLAELVPRSFFRAYGSKLLPAFSQLINFFHEMFYPVASVFVSLSEWVLKVFFDIKIKEDKQIFTRYELSSLFHRGNDPSETSLNTELFQNALELPNVRIRQCLVPRKEITGIEINKPIADLKKLFTESKLTRIIVYEGDIDHIAGYVHQLAMFKNPDSIKTVLLPVPAVPESMSAADLISKFNRERKSIAWVVDEFGGTSGIITMEDVLEEIFGEIEDEYDVKEFVEKQISEDEFIFSGRLELDSLAEEYGLKFTENDAETLSGYIIAFHETIPTQKERIIIGDYQFDIMSVSNTRIEMVKLKKLG